MSPHRRRDDRARVARAVGTRILACAIALALVAAPARAATSVTVAMRAGWRATSGALEALIGVGDVGDADAFWWTASALDRSREDDSVDCARSVRRVVEGALRDGGRARAMGLALGARAYRRVWRAFVRWRRGRREGARRVVESSSMDACTRTRRR